MCLYRRVVRCHRRIRGSVVKRPPELGRLGVRFPVVSYQRRNACQRLNPYPVCWCFDIRWLHVYLSSHILDKLKITLGYNTENTFNCDTRWLTYLIDTWHGTVYTSIILLLSEHFQDTWRLHDETPSEMNYRGLRSNTRRNDESRYLGRDSISYCTCSTCNLL